jgi:hydroxymethylglutaryl-CoA synthase
MPNWKGIKMNIGIDSIAFSTSKYFIKLETLAQHRGVNYAKYCIGIGQTKMSVFPPNEDIVTLAVDAAEKALSRVTNTNDIDMLIFATESAFDLSKSTGIYVHHFLKLKEDCRVFDLKQACYSATAALHLAKSYIFEHPESKVLIIASDIVRYSANTSGEPTQGGAAVAMIVSQNPRILAIENNTGLCTMDVMDFWRPIYKREALFDSKLSIYNYLKSLEITYVNYLKTMDRKSADIDYMCYHAPFGKMARKANSQIFKDRFIENTLIYNSIIGNSCTASLYICFISLLDNAAKDLSRKRIGFFSYGSGSVAEFFSGIVSNGYDKMLSAKLNQNMLDARIEISFVEYEEFFRAQMPSELSTKYQNSGRITLAKIENDQRIYE